MNRSPIYSRFFAIAALASSSVSNSATASPLVLTFYTYYSFQVVIGAKGEIENQFLRFLGSHFFNLAMKCYLQ